MFTSDSFSLLYNSNKDMEGPGVNSFQISHAALDECLQRSEIVTHSPSVILQMGYM